MNIQGERLEGRLRGLFGSLDARAGFEERVMARVTSLAAERGAVLTDLRAQFERRRELTRRRLRRAAWSNGINTGGIGVAAAALVWHFLDRIVQWLEPVASGQVDPVLAGGVALAAVAAAVVFIVRRPSRLLG